MRCASSFSSSSSSPGAGRAQRERKKRKKKNNQEKNKTKKKKPKKKKKKKKKLRREVDQNKMAWLPSPGSSSPLASRRSRQVRRGPAGWYLQAAPPLHAPPARGSALPAGGGRQGIPARRSGGVRAPALLRGIGGARPGGGGGGSGGRRRGSGRRGALAGLPRTTSMYSYIFRAARVNICRQKRRPPMAAAGAGPAALRNKTF